MRLQRPRHLLSCTILGASLLLSACGFHLRGSGVNNVTLDELHVSVQDRHSQTHQQVVEALQDSGVALRRSAPYHLQLLDEPRERRAVSYSRGSTSAEYELSHQLRFQVSNATGQVLVGPETLTTYRSYVSDRDNLVASSEEERLLQREMRQDLTRQLMLRLSRLSVEDLAARERALERPAD